MHRVPRLLAVLVATATVLLGPFAVTASASAPAPGANLSAEIEKSIVKLNIELSGKVRFPTNGGGEDVTEAVELTSFCSGFFVSSEGDIVTAGHCADPKEFKLDFVTNALEQLAKAGRLCDGCTPKSELEYAMENWTPEGPGGKGTQPDIRITVNQPDDVKAPVEINDRLAQVIALQPFDEGDLALLKLAGITGTLPLPVATKTPQVRDALTSIGFPAIVNQQQDPNRRASFKEGTVSSLTTTEKGVPRIEVSTDISNGMSGGPTVDAEGNVVGVNSSGFTSQGGGAFNFVTDTARLQNFLTTHSVTPVAPRAAATTESGQAPTSAIPAPASEGGFPWWIIAVVAAVLVAAGVAYLLWQRSHKRRPPQQPAAAAPGPGGYGNGPGATAYQGAPLGYQDAPAAPVVCSHANNPIGAKFCSTCGAPLASANVTSRTGDPAPGSSRLGPPV